MDDKHRKSTIFSLVSSSMWNEKNFTDEIHTKLKIFFTRWNSSWNFIWDVLCSSGIEAKKISPAFCRRNFFHSRPATHRAFHMIFYGLLSPKFCFPATCKKWEIYMGFHDTFSPREKYSQFCMDFAISFHAELDTRLYA